MRVNRHPAHRGYIECWGAWKTRAAVVAVALAALVLALGVGGCTRVVIQEPPSTSGPSASTTLSASTTTTTPGPGTSRTTITVTTGPGPVTAQVSPAEAVAAAVGPSVVNVAVEGTRPGLGGRFSGEGSGVILTSDGMIITNNHVISEDDRPVDTIEVTLATGEKLPATIVGRDPLTDLAVIKVEKPGLPAATFIEDMADVKIGEYAIAIGSPLGFANSVTLGVVSGLQREIAVPAAQGGQALIDLIQTDAAISPGNSGGALANSAGQVIGINVAYLPPGSTGAQNVGFAIQADLAVSVAQQLIQNGRVSHAYMGVRPVTVTAALQEQFGLSRDSGVLLGQVDPDTPADRAGLRTGDIIIRLDDTVLTSEADLFKFLRKKRPGDIVTVVIDREGRELSLPLRLGERPQ